MDDEKSIRSMPQVKPSEYLKEKGWRHIGSQGSIKKTQFDGNVKAALDAIGADKDNSARSAQIGYA